MYKTELMANQTIKYLFSNTMITFYLSYSLLSYLTNGLKMMQQVNEECE